MKYQVIDKDPVRLPYPWIPIPALPELFEMKKGQSDFDQFMAACILDIGGEVYAVFSLMEALSCSNIKTETLLPPEKLNKRRLERGHSPFLSYKILTLDVPLSENRKSEGTGTHASPRMHLRRGHIRRLENGKKIWVNSCIVGEPENGIMEKTYKIRKTIAGGRRPAFVRSIPMEK